MEQMTWEDWNPYRGMEPRHILAVLVICLFVSLVYEGAQWLWGRRTEERRYIRRSVWIGFTLFYVYTILCATVLGRTDGREPEMRTSLFWTLEAALRTGEWIYWYYIAGNILMFVPLGFVLVHLFTEGKENPSYWKSLIYSTFLCMVLSVLIEGTQYMTGSGLCEADDLLHNALGGGIGALAYLLFRHLQMIF